MQTISSFSEKDYILKAADLQDLESLFIPVKTKKEQQKLFTRLCEYAKTYCLEVDPSISLAVHKTFQDKKLWIKILKDKAPTELYILKPSGAVVSTSLDTEVKK